MNKRVPSDAVKGKVLARDGYVCRYCGSKKGPFEIDHVYPYSKGGATTLGNLVVSCKRCNLAKHSKIGIWPLPLYSELPKEVLLGYVFTLLAIGIVTVLLTGIGRTFPGNIKFDIVIISAAFLLVGFIFQSIAVSGRKK